MKQNIFFEIGENDRNHQRAFCGTHKLSLTEILLTLFNFFLGEKTCSKGVMNFQLEVSKMIEIVSIEQTLVIIRQFTQLFLFLIYSFENHVLKKGSDT
jgi:hypothetical protein